jgi:hypothetical protein
LLEILCLGIGALVVRRGSNIEEEEEEEEEELEEVRR